MNSLSREHGGKFRVEKTIRKQVIKNDVYKKIIAVGYRTKDKAGSMRWSYVMIIKKKFKYERQKGPNW